MIETIEAMHVKGKFMRCTYCDGIGTLPGDVTKWRRRDCPVCHGSGLRGGQHTSPEPGEKRPDPPPSPPLKTDDITAAQILKLAEIVDQNFKNIKNSMAVQTKLIMAGWLVMVKKNIATHEELLAAFNEVDAVLPVLMPQFAEEK